ncbi:unnamed protein product, partial [Cuscuta epithymum]
MMVVVRMDQDGATHMSRDDGGDWWCRSGRWLRQAGVGLGVVGQSSDWLRQSCSWTAAGGRPCSDDRRQAMGRRPTAGHGPAGHGMPAAAGGSMEVGEWRLWFGEKSRSLRFYRFNVNGIFV